MKIALFLVLSLSALALAGPAFNKNNQIQQQQQQQDAIKQQQQQQYMTGTDGAAKSPAIDILKQWCFSSQMSQQELTASFKKLVSVIKSNPIDQTTESAVMNERICQGALVAKSQQTGETVSQGQADAKAHELIKDVYMDAMISCKSHECTQQLLKIVQSQQVDAIRASYYMTRIAVTDKQEIKDEQEIKSLAESFLNNMQQQHQQGQQQQSEAVERQQLFATTSLIGKWIVQKPAAERQQIVEVAEQVAKTIVERYVKQVSQQEVEQYKKAEAGQVQPELAKKIAKRSAALKALANIPGHVLKQCREVEQQLVQIAENKQELSTVRQSAIECLEQNEQQMDTLKRIAFEESEPIEVRVAAYRALMTSIYASSEEQQQQQQQQQKNSKTEEQKKSIAEQLVNELVKHCEQKQQQDEQFVLYVVSHLDNIRSSQQPEVAAIKETIAENKQHYMQIQLLAKKLAKQLSDVRRSSRNYKLEQEFEQISSGLVLEGDLIYESHAKKQMTGEILPKLVRVNMSMPVMGETVNVVEITLRQDNMDSELLGALKLVQNAKFNQETVSKVVDSFKQSAERQQQQQQSGKQTKQAEADLTIKVDGRTVVFVCLDDFKSSSNNQKNYSQQQQQQHQRNTRSVYQSASIMDEIVEYLKREPVTFNRGFNFNIQERIAKVLDVDVNAIAGMRFESRAQGASKKDFEIVAQMEPRFSFEAIVGPAKLSSKKLLQRFSTKSALGLRLRFKENELVDVELELPMNTMELFTFESQIVEKNTQTHSYSYLPESIYGQEDIYASYPMQSQPDFYSTAASKFLAKRSIVSSFGSQKKNQQSLVQQLAKIAAFSHVYETPKSVERATGLVGKLRMVASPKDMSVLVSCVLQKTESQMRGLRVKIEQTGGRSSADVKSYTLTAMTPGSSVDRTMQVRLTKQSSQARTLVKAEIQGPQMSALFSTELIHDGRQFSVKSEIVSRSQKQWRHALEAGFISGPSSSSSGRLAHFNYKPYVQIESSSLKRPIAMQGQIAYVQSPKSVISYELKCATTGDFIQGKLIFDQRDNKMSQQQKSRSGSMSFRRSMSSPLELIASQDLTLTSEFIAQIAEHAVKAHQMIDWDCQKYSVQANSLVSHKNLRKQQQQQQPNEIVANMKIDAEQQVFSVERKSATDARKQWAVRVVSIVRPSGHQMELECRKQQNSAVVVAYKHKIDVQKIAANKYECAIELELVDVERRINESASGKARISTERKQKQAQLELIGSRSKSAKLSVDYESLAKHQIVFVATNERVSHKTELRNNERQFVVVSRTEQTSAQKQLVKLLVEVEKQVAPIAAKLALEIPAKRVNVGADLKLASGKRSSIAVQTGRFAAQTEFSFDLKDVRRSAKDSFSRFYPFERSANVRVRSNLKDLSEKQAYFMESQLNGADWNEPSFLRVESPIYSSELEFSPRSQEAKFAAFARTQRPAYSQQLDSLNKQRTSSLFEQIGSLAQEKLSLGPSKMWMLRSIVASPFARDQLKQQARRALFEYADRRQSHKHSFNYSPAEERINMELTREPNTEFVKTNTFEPLRLKADLSTELSRPSTISFDSEWMSADVEAKPFGHRADEIDSESYAKISALSRHPRSAFREHESELRYNKKSGYKAHMKHRDSRDKRHELRAETDAQPAKWAKLAYESDKHGKTNWEHKWRQQQQKRTGDQESVYANSMWLKREAPQQQQQQQQKWQHETKFDWEEPTRMINERRYRRSIFNNQQEQEQNKKSILSLNQIAKLAQLANIYPATAEYLKQTSGRLVSSYAANAEAMLDANNQYKLDFDYKPHANFASMNVQMPQEMSHLSSLEIKPTERLYKLQSKLYNRRTNEPTYELYASSKQQPMIADLTVDKLATAEQEPVFVHSSHPMLERPISTESLVYKLMRQPMKLDYSDKYGRVANFDYDQLATAVLDAKIQQQQQQQIVGGLRQKRAAFFYKDPMADIEHSTSFDFYPETVLGQMKPSFYQQNKKTNTYSNQQENTTYAPVAIKTNTKYGPVIVRADSSDSTTYVELQSPIVNAKLVGETAANLRTLYKIQLDNKSQRVQLVKLLREAPKLVREQKIVKSIARKFDAIKFEHQSELLVSVVEQIFKIKSATKVDQRQVLEIEGEWNQQSDKAYATINGQYVNGQVIVDLVRKTAELNLSLDDKRTLHHVTRLVKTSDKFYTLESMTTHKQRPVFKMTAQVSAKVFDLEHLLETSSSSYERRHESSPAFEQREHLSTFEAVVYEPKELHITGQFDCDKKQARIVIKDVEEQKVQETELRFEPQTETIYMISQLTSKHEGQVYSTEAKINLPGLYQSEKCQRNANKYTANKYASKYATKYTKMTDKMSTNYESSCKSEIIYSDKQSSGVWAAQYYPGQYLTVSSPRGESTFNLAY